MRLHQCAASSVCVWLLLFALPKNMVEFKNTFNSHRYNYHGCGLYCGAITRRDNVTVQPKNNARKRTSFYIRTPDNFLWQIADACAWVLQTTTTSLRLEAFNSKNFFAVRLWECKNFFALQILNRPEIALRILVKYILLVQCHSSENPSHNNCFVIAIKHCNL